MAVDATHDILIAVIGSLSLILVAVVPVLWASMRHLHQKADRTYAHINNLEEAEAVDGTGSDTLGSVLRDVQREVRTGFVRNDETHQAIIRVVEAQGETVHDHGQRLDAHRAELDRLCRDDPADGDTIPR